jgi:hypothetical protein
MNESVNLLTYNQTPFESSSQTHAILARVLRQAAHPCIKLHRTENSCACMHA